MKNYIYADFDFSLLSNPDFKEDSVREALIKPLLDALGYADSGKNRIVRSRGLTDPFVNIGSKRTKIRMIPDYLLEVGGQYAWVLDAKSPNEVITSGEHIEQIYSYAIHPDVRVNFYALCNGREFVLFEIGRRDAILYFQLSELERYWHEIERQLQPSAFEKVEGIRELQQTLQPHFNYMATKPPVEVKDPQKQSAKRHYGVHGYFTKQVWNVVQEYIKSLTKPGDIVLDPFGGSGITAIEALILGRRGIHIDINPLSIFLVDSLLVPIDFNSFAEEYRRIRDKFEQTAPEQSGRFQTHYKNILILKIYFYRVIRSKNS